jgi:uncharacterized damage-inducible protein DinB
MPVSADTLRLHIDYMEWASRRILDAAAELTPEERLRDFKTGDKNVLETLVHVFAADRLWLKRVVNHGTHHRGMVSGFLRAMGHTPPPLDLIAYYRAL